MPMKPITVKANFQLDTSAARAQLQGLQRELSSVTKGATMNLGMTEEITNAVKQAELLKQILREATDIGTGNFDLSKFTQAMNQNMTSIQKFKESLASLGPEGEKTFNSLANTIASAQVPLKRTSQGVQELMTAFGNTMRWQATSMAMHKMVGTIQQAYNYAQNLDKSLTNISIVTGHNADYMRNFAREANKAAQALSASTLEYTNASLIYYQQGLGDKEVAKRAETTLKLAKVTGESASKVSQQMTAVWNNFSNGVDNLERYADVMAALGATTASSSSEIAKGLEKFASVTKTIGLSYDYAASALATVTAQTRQSADSVGTAFKTLFSRLESLNLGETLDDSVTLNKYSEALLKAGVNVMDVNGHLKNMDAILDELGNQWNNLNKAQQVALAQTIGGVRNYTSLITLMDNWQDFQNNVVTSQLAEGTLQQQADIYAKSWEAAQQRVKTASQGIYDTLISSDFFKGFNNAFAGILNQVNDLGKHLGTGGSLAGLMALTGYFAGDKIAGRLDNAAVNFLGSTRYGQAASARAKAETFADMSRAISLNGDQLDTRRLNVLDATADAWKEYARVVNNNGRHGNAYISQPAMQGYYNQLSTLTERGLAAMNLSVDAKTAVTTRQNVDAKAYQDLARLGSKTITGQKRPTINTSGIIDILDSNGVTQGQLNGIAQRKVLLNFQEQLNSASSPAARRSIIANMQRYVDSGLNQSVKNTGEAILKELNSNPDGVVTSDAAKLFGALSQQTERMQAGVTTRAFNIGVHNRADLFKGADGKTVQTTVAEMVNARVNEAVTDLTAGLAVEGVQEGMEQLKPDQNIKEYKGIRGAIQYWRDTKGQAIKDRAINGLRARQYDEKDSEGNVIGQKYYTQTTGEFIMQTAQVFNTLSMATSSFQSSLDSLSQGTLTASQALGTLGSGAMAISTLSSTLLNNKKLTNAFGSMAGGFLPSLYQNLGSTALGSKLGLGAEGVLTAGGALTSLGAAIPIALAVGALGITAKEYQEYKRNTSEARLSRANESKIALSALSKENKNKADNYLSVVSSQQQSYNKLLGLQPGTTAYTSQLLSSNAQAQELIDTYNLQAGKDYNIDENGAYYFSAEQIRNSDEQIRDQANQSMLLSQLANDRIYQLQDYANDLSARPYGMIEAMKSRKVTLYGSESLTQSEIDNKLSTEEKMQYLAMSPEEYAKKVTGENSGNAYDREVAAMRKDQLELQGYITAEQRAQSSYQSSLNAYISTQENITDAQRVAISLLGENSTKQREYQSELYRLSKDDLKNIKKNGKYLEVGQLQKEYLDHSDIYNLPLDRSLTNDQLGAMMESLQAQYYMKQQIKEIIEDYDLENTDISAYSNLTSMSYDSFNKMITEHNGAEYQNLNIMALNKWATAQENLAQALLHNTNLQDTNFREQSRLIQETLNLSINQQESLANYINNFGTNFGDNTGKAIYDALTTNGEKWNSQFYETLQNISTSSNIASVADLTYQSTLTKNADLQQSMENLRKAMIADIEDRGGLAKALFTSSDFTKVFDSLSEQYKATGSITAQNIADLAKKNDIIGQYMRASGSNEQTVADLMEMVASGDIGTEGITPALEHFVQNMNGSEGAQQEALDTLENYDFSDSITTLDKGYQNIGKVFYNARVNDVLYDNPVREALDLLLTPDDRAKFERIMAIQAYGGTTKDIMSMIQEYMPQAYAALSELEGKGKKKGKGGGGFDTAIEYWSKMGLFDGSGIEVDESTGRITFGEGFSEGYDALNGEGSQVTAQGFKDYVVSIFKNAGVSEELANTWASQVTGTLSASSFGSLFNSGALIDSVQGLWGDLTGEEALGRNLTGEQINAIFNQYREVFARMKIDNGELKELTADELKDFENNPGITDIAEWQDYIAKQARKNGVAIIDIKGKELLNGKSAAAIGQAIADNSMKTITESGISGLVQAAVMSGVQQYRDYNLTIGRPEEIGKSLDYDQLQRFYTDTLGLTTEDLTRHIDELNKEGTGVTHKWTDAYGVEHNLSSRGMTGAEFTQKISHDAEVTQQIIDMQRQQWITEIMSNPENADWTYQDILAEVNRREALQRQAVMAEAREGVQSSPDNTTSPEGGEETETPEGEEEAPPEGEGTSNKPTGTNGLTAEQQTEMNDASKFVYQNDPLKEEIYKYWKWHGGTQAEAWDAVVKRGERAPEEAFPVNQGETRPSNAEMRAFLRANGYSDKDITQALKEGENLSDLYGQVQTRVQNEKIAASQTAALGDNGQRGVNQTVVQTASDMLANDAGIGVSLPDNNQRIQAWMGRGYTREEAEKLINGATIKDIQDARVREEERQVGIQRNAQMSSNAYNDEQRYITYMQQQRAAEEERQQREAQREAEKAAAEQQQREIEEQAERAALTASMPPSEYAKYRAWVEAGGSGSAIDWQYEKRAAEGPRAPEVGEKETKEKEPSNKEMREFLKENGYTSATINTAMREEGVSLKDLYQRVNSALTETNKQLKGINENTNVTAENTGDFVQEQQDQQEQKTTDKAIGKDQTKGKDSKNKDIFDNTGNTTIINESGGSDSGGDDGWYPGGPSKDKTKVNLSSDFKDKIKGIIKNQGITGGKGTDNIISGKSNSSSNSKLDSGASKGNLKIEISLASGQNNARLLSYASGKEGHIAVTGELGPELRVKSDGSMDILGKTGREYAWVEPDDKIYTASQSAGILKSNKIPGLEGLAKGINNFIPGYATSFQVQSNGGSNDKGGSSSGGSPSGSGGRSRGGGTPTEVDPRYDPNTLKIRDVLERYYTILQKIDDITRAVEKFAKVADRAWGEDRIKAIEKQTALYQQQYDAQKKYVQEIGEYMNTDSAALTTMIREFVEGYNEGKEDKDKLSWAGAQFDSNGVLTNYRDFVEKLVEQYNANAQANAMNKEAQYKFQEQLKDIQMYTDTLNLWESETDKLQELANQILDNSLKEITYRVEYELELNADQKRLLDFRDSFVKDDIFRVAEHIANMNEEIANTAKALKTTRQGIYDYLGTLAGENMRLGEFYDDVALGLATRDEKGVVDAKSYEDIDFTEVSNNLDKWLAELREKDEESAKEVDKIIKRNEEGLIINYRDTLNKINEINKQLSNDSISLLLTNARSFFDQISDLSNNPQWTGLSTEMKDQITNYMDQLIQYIQSMGEEFKEIIESMGDSIKTFGKKMDAEVDEFDYYEDVYKSFGNIIDLTNQHMTDITSDFFKTLNNKALDNNINKIEVARRRYELFAETFRQVSEQYNEMLKRVSQAPNGSEEQAFYQQRADELKEQLDIAKNQMESEYKELLQTWEDALSKAQESYKQAIEKASKDFEKSFSPLFNTLALLQAQFDREKALGDLYVDNYQRIHDLNKLDRDIQNSINDTDNLKGKQRLRDLQEEINQLQENGNDLSEYDLDILDKKYKLELARQALEDAKDAKSMVRLARDNNGNWSYVYTANQDDVDKAEQDYEDAIRDMEQANEDYIKNIQDQIVQVQQEAQQAILALQPEDFATYDDYLAAVQNIQNSMYQTLDYLRSQMNNAFGNNQWLENYIPNIIQDHGLTDDFGNTILSDLLANDNLNSIIQDAKNNFENNLIAPALEAFTLYSEKQKEAYIAAGKDIATIGQSFGEEMDKLTDKSEEQVKVVMDLADRVENSFGSAMEEVISATAKWLNQIKDIVAEYDILLAKITELKEIDGKYVEPAKMINGDNAIDDWAEIDRFKRELRDNGILNVITTDTETGKEKSTQYIAADTEKINAFLKDASIAAAKKDIDQFDLGDDGVDDAENSKVKAYLAQHGYVWVKYKGEELMFDNEDEWDAWRNKHKPAPSANEPDGWWRNPYIVGGSTKDELAHWGGLDTGGYTGRWQSADTGMYTGEWPSGSVRRNGRLAWLHQKELVLNAHDTENFLDAMQIVRQLDNLTNWMANGLGDLIIPNVSSEMGELEQNVHIEAEFPNVTDHNEIEQAFNNLVNMASQYANRK